MFSISWQVRSLPPREELKGTNGASHASAHRLSPHTNELITTNYTGAQDIYIAAVVAAELILNFRHRVWVHRGSAVPEPPNEWYSASRLRRRYPGSS